MTRAARRGRPCTVCRHPEREAIDRALVNGATAGAIAAQFRELSEDAVQRHRSAHVPERLAKAQDVKALLEADDLLGQVRLLQRQALGILGSAANAGDLRTALGAIREARGNLELLAKLMGELSEGPTVNVLVAPEWVAIRAVILRALDPHPDARLAVAGALEGYVAGA